MSATMAGRTAGKLCRGGGPWIRLTEAGMLEERVSDHHRGCVTMKTMPGPTSEAVEAKFLFQLLMGLLADPSRLDCASQIAQVHLGWQLGKIVFLFSREALLADDGSHQQRWIKISPVLPVASSIMGFEDEVDQSLALQRYRLASRT